MATRIGEELDSALMERLRGGALYRPGGLGLPILSCDRQGWPHVAMVSGAVAHHAGAIFFALGGNSSSLGNVERDPHVTLLIAAPDTLYYVKGVAEVVRREMQVTPQEAAVRLSISAVLQDMEPSLRITGGISYQYDVTDHDDRTMVGAMLDELQSLAEEDRTT